MSTDEQGPGRCRFRHRWSWWSDFSIDKWGIAYQTRTCSRCGKAQQNRCGT